jgi:hypothetical protein
VSITPPLKPVDSDREILTGKGTQIVDKSRLDLMGKIAEFGPLGLTNFYENWGRCPQRRVKGWVLAILAMLALWAVRGSGLLWSPLRGL